MASFITAGNATNGLQVSSDNTGILELRTGTGSGTTAVTIGATQNATFAGSVGVGTSSPAVTLHAANTSGGGVSGANPSGEVSRIQQTPSFGSGGFVAQRLFLNKTSTANDGVTQSFEGLAVGGDRYALANIGGYIDNAGSGNSVSGYFAILTKPTNASITERARITSDGDFLIGTTTGGSKLAVSDSNNRTEATAQFRIGGSGYSIYQWLDGTAAYIGQDSGSRSFRIYSSAETAGVNLAAGGTSWGTFSDERLKYDIEPIVDGLTKLANMRCVSYRLKDVDAEDSQKKLGVIAQDLVGVVDEVIDITKRSGDDTEYMSVRYTELTPVLIKAIQEQQAMIDEMKAEIAALKAQP